MQTLRTSPLSDSPQLRFSLSTRGYAAVALRPNPASAKAVDGGERLDSERAQWAYAHGLQPLDGAYLSELERRPLTLRQLGEALAILSQTSHMVKRTMLELQSLGLVEPAPGLSLLRCEKAIETELSAALNDLEFVLSSIEDEGQLARRTASVTLRRAMSRVVAARRFASAPEGAAYQPMEK